MLQHHRYCHRKKEIEAELTAKQSPPTIELDIPTSKKIKHNKTNNI
jgi:hypothetical protein